MKRALYFEKSLQIAFVLVLVNHIFRCTRDTPTTYLVALITVEYKKKNITLYVIKPYSLSLDNLQIWLT